MRELQRLEQSKAKEKRRSRIIYLEVAALDHDCYYLHFAPKKKSFQWKDEIDSKVLLPNGEPLPVVLIGNKCDLVEGGDTIDPAVEEFVQKKRFIGYFRTSAKSNINIDKSARFLVEEILKQRGIFDRKEKAAVSVLFKIKVIFQIINNNFCF